MISGGNATVIVANMDKSIRFYTNVLGLKLTNRFGNDWATVSAGAFGQRLGLPMALLLDFTRHRPNIRAREQKVR